MNNLQSVFRIPTLGGMRHWNDWFVYAGWRIQRHVISGRCRLLDPNNIRIYWGSFDECKAYFFKQKEVLGISPISKEMVVLMHGLGRTHHSMKKMAQTFKNRGYEACSISYPSTKRHLHEHSYKAGYLFNELTDIETLHFVTYGMAGLILRLILDRDAEWKNRIKIGRIVTINTPHQGAQVANDMKNFLPYRMVFGPAGAELTTEYVSKNIPKFSDDLEFGIIAGGKGNEKGYNGALGSDNNFVVKVKETKLEGAKDFALLNAMHFSATNNHKVIEESINFIKTGYFAKS